MPRALPSWEKDDVTTLEHFARISLVVADLDGTLVQPMGDHVSETIRSLASKLRSRSGGVSLTLATGRAMAGVRTLLNNLALKRSVPIALYNGGLVLVPGQAKPIHHRTIEMETFRITLDLVTDAGASVLSYHYGVPGDELNSATQEAESVWGWGHRYPTKDINGLSVFSGDESYVGSNDTSGPVAMLIECERDSSTWENLTDQLSKLPGINITSSSSRFIEIRPPGSNKATALAAIANFMQIDRDQILAIGDNDNDSEMLEWVGIGVAVQGASRLALKNSDYYCRHAVDRGVVEVLRILRQAKRYKTFLLATPGEEHEQ